MPQTCLASGLLMSKEVYTYVEELHQAAVNQNTCWGSFWNTVLYFGYLRDEELDNLVKAQRTRTKLAEVRKKSERLSR